MSGDNFKTAQYFLFFFYPYFKQWRQIPSMLHISFSDSLAKSSASIYIFGNTKFAPNVCFYNKIVGIIILPINDISFNKVCQTCMFLSQMSQLFNFLMYFHTALLQWQPISNDFVLVCSDKW